MDVVGINSTPKVIALSSYSVSTQEDNYNGIPAGKNLVSLEDVVIGSNDVDVDFYVGDLSDNDLSVLTPGYPISDSESYKQGIILKDSFKHEIIRFDKNDLLPNLAPKKYTIIH